MMMSAAAPTALPVGGPGPGPVAAAVGATAPPPHKLSSVGTTTSDIVDEKKENPSSEDVAAAAAVAAAGGAYMVNPHHIYHHQQQQHQQQAAAAAAAAAHTQQPYAMYPNGMVMATAPTATHHHQAAAPHHFMGVNHGMTPHQQQQVYMGMALQQQQQQQQQQRAASAKANNSNDPTAATSSPSSSAMTAKPQQRYQSGFMLQSQFQSLSLDANSGSGGGNTSHRQPGGNDGSGGGDETNGGGNDGGDHHKEGDKQGGGGDGSEVQRHNEDEDEPLKLFVGQVPKNMNEEDIFPTFDAFGPLKDVSIIRDKHTQLHRGCAFVTYWSAADAEKAQAELHGKHTFPGGRRPAQVKPAEASVRENKLFIGMLAKETSEEDIRVLFEPFGEIKEIFLIRNHDGSSKCAAFLRYVDTDAAEQAINTMHSSLTLEGAQRPLIVKYADNKRQREQRHMRNIRRHEMMTMPPGAYGYPPHMAMGPPGPGAHPHQYSMAGAHPQYGAPYASAGGAHAAYHPQMYAPHQYSAPHHAAPYGAFQHQPPGNRHSNNSAASSSSGGNSVGNTAGGGEGTSTSSRNPNPRPREGPAGANLFVYHLPHDLTDADLATAFNPFGNVISAKVYVDRFTGESKGFGFVSYDSVISAESAIEQMNGFQIGNKRLKVQHKRVHVNQGGGGGGSGSDHGNQNFMPHQMMPLDPSGQQVVLDTGLGQTQGMHPGDGAASSE